VQKGWNWDEPWKGNDDKVYTPAEWSIWWNQYSGEQWARWATSQRKRASPYSR
jgi:hypothetical protein